MSGAVLEGITVEVVLSVTWEQRREPTVEVAVAVVGILMVEEAGILMVEVTGVMKRRVAGILKVEVGVPLQVEAL